MEIGPDLPRPALTRVTVWVTAPLGFGGFLGLRERSSSYINARGAACPSQVEFFIILILVVKGGQYTWPKGKVQIIINTKMRT